MAAAVRVRRDYEAAQIRVLAKRSKNAAQTRRLLALAAIYDGGSRTEAARIGGVGRTISGRARPTSSGPFARLKGSPPGLLCRAAIPPPWLCIMPRTPEA